MHLNPANVSNYEEIKRSLDKAALLTDADVVFVIEFAGSLLVERGYRLNVAVIPTQLRGENCWVEVSVYRNGERIIHVVDGTINRAMSTFVRVLEYSLEADMLPYVGRNYLP